MPRYIHFKQNAPQRRLGSSKTLQLDKSIMQSSLKSAASEELRSVEHMRRRVVNRATCRCLVGSQICFPPAVRFLCSHTWASARDHPQSSECMHEQPQRDNVSTQVDQWRPGFRCHERGDLRRTKLSARNLLHITTPGQRRPPRHQKTRSDAHQTLSKTPRS